MNASFLSTVALVVNISKNALDSRLEMFLTLSMAAIMRSAQIILAILDVKNDPLPHDFIALI